MLFAKKMRTILASDIKYTGCHFDYKNISIVNIFFISNVYIGRPVAVAGYARVGRTNDPVWHGRAVKRVCLAVE